MSHYPNVEQHYLPFVEIGRARGHADLRVRALLSPAAGRGELLPFLLEFCALGVRMMRPVQGWMERSARACVSAGFIDLGVALRAAARGEDQRHLLLIDDLVQLAELWRSPADPGARPGPRLDLGALVRREPPESVRSHARIRLAACALERPYLAVGVELELAVLSRYLGPQLIRACERALGSDVLRGLRFIQARSEHGALSEHTWLTQLEALLRVFPEYGEPIAALGSAASDAMLDFVGDCFSSASVGGEIDRGAAIGLAIGLAS